MQTPIANTTNPKIISKSRPSFAEFIEAKDRADFVSFVSPYLQEGPLAADAIQELIAADEARRKNEMFKAGGLYLETLTKLESLFGSAHVCYGLCLAGIGFAFRSSDETRGTAIHFLSSAIEHLEALKPSLQHQRVPHLYLSRAYFELGNCEESLSEAEHYYIQSAEYLRANCRADLVDLTRQFDLLVDQWELVRAYFMLAALHTLAEHPEKARKYTLYWQHEMGMLKDVQQMLANGPTNSPVVRELVWKSEVIHRTSRS